MQQDSEAAPRAEQRPAIEPFSRALGENQLELTRAETTTLQVNVGLVCNLTCRHCHLECGPRRPELMDAATVDAVLDCARRLPFQVIDVTGGAPEMNPELPRLLRQASALAPRVMLRSNLTLLGQPARRELLELCVEQRVVLVGSLPASNASQTDAQRGQGVLEQTIGAIRALNQVGYGLPDSGLTLDLVANPTGAFLPVSQEQAEKKFRRDLQRKWGLAFNNLYTFANVPLGRFKGWLQESGNYQQYLERLASAFNPCAVEGVMCRYLLSVGWDGYLFDCDFNLALGLPAGGRRTHVSELRELPRPGDSICYAEHCYTCTAGAGFT